MSSKRATAQVITCTRAWVGGTDLNSSGFAELLDGVISVRAFSVEKRFMNLLCEQVDKTHSAFYYYWVSFRLARRWPEPRPRS